MLHEVSFPSYNQRDTVQGWIYVPAAQPRGIVQLVHGFGEHSRRYFHMIVKLMDAGFIVAADDHVGHGKTAMMNNTWGDWGDAGFRTMMEDEHRLTTVVKEKYPNLPYFMFGHSMGSFYCQRLCGQIWYRIGRADYLRHRRKVPGCGGGAAFAGSSSRSGQRERVGSPVCRSVNGLDGRTVRRGEAGQRMDLCRLLCAVGPCAGSF